MQRSESVSLAGGSLTLSAIKRGVFTTGSANATFSSGGSFNYMQRIMVSIPYGTTRWRLRIANINSTTNSLTGLGNFGTLDTVYLGKPVYGTNGRWQGDMTNPVNAFTSAATPWAANGVDAVTPWVTNTAQIAGHTNTIVSMALTAAAGGSGLIQNDTLCYASIGGAANVGSASALGLGASPLVLDIRIEYESSVPALSPVGLVCSASDPFYNPDNPLSPNEGWPSALALSKNQLIFNGAEGGTAIANWSNGAGTIGAVAAGAVTLTSTVTAAANQLVTLGSGSTYEQVIVTSVTGSGPYTLTVPPIAFAHPASTPIVTGRPWTRLFLGSSTPNTFVPDYAIIGFGIISNEITGMTGGDTATAPQIATALAAIKNDILNLISIIHNYGINRIYISTVPPRNFGGSGSFESLRNQTNAWLRTLPLGVEALAEIDRHLRGQSSLLVLDPIFAASDGVHINWTGEQEVSAAVGAVIPQLVTV